MPTKTKTQSMETLVEEVGAGIVPFHQGDVISVQVVSSTKSKIVVNVMDLAMGFIPAREFSVDPSEIKAGDTISAYVLSPENDDGWVVLSMRRADRERVWGQLVGFHKSGEELEVRVTDAMRAGVLVEYKGTEGFIPASQLGGGHEGSAPGKLKELVGKNLTVKAITVDPKQNKLIFSERAAQQGKLSERASQLKPGERLTGTITGVVDFGLFVDIGAGAEGLVHISEVSWERIENLREHFKVGQTLEVEILSVEDGKISLSLKRLTPDPWIEAVRQLEIGSLVEGEVVRLTQFGAFVKLAGDVQGLVHVSELGENIKNPEEVVKVGDKKQFRILSIDPLAHKISLSYRSAETESAPEDAPASQKKSKKRPERSTKKEE